MNSRSFLWRGSLTNVWQHGAWLVIRICLIVILRESSVVSENVGISAATICLVLYSNISVKKLCTVQLSHGAPESTDEGLRPTLDLGTVERQHFIYIKFKCLKCNSLYYILL